MLLIFAVLCGEYARQDVTFQLYSKGIPSFLNNRCFFFLFLAAFSIPSSSGRVHYTPPHTPNHRIYRFFLDLARNPEKVERCLEHAELPWVRLVNGRDIGLLVRKRIGSGRVPLETCPPEKYEELFEDNVKIA